MRQEQGPFCPLVSIAYEKAARCALNMCAWYSASSGSCAVLACGCSSLARMILW